MILLLIQPKNDSSIIEINILRFDRKIVWSYDHDRNFSDLVIDNQLGMDRDNKGMFGFGFLSSKKMNVRFYYVMHLIVMELEIFEI